MRLCNYRVIAPKKPSKNLQLVPIWWVVHRRLNVCALLVAVAFDHAQILVAANPLHCGQIHTSLHQVRDRGMAQRVAHHLFDIQPRRQHTAAKWLVQIDRTPVLGCG